MSQHPRPSQGSTDQLFLNLSSAVTLHGAIRSFLNDLELENRTARTLLYNKGNLERFEWYAEQNNLPAHLTEINSGHIKMFLNYVQTNPHRWGNAHPAGNRPASTTTVVRYRAVLHAFWQWAVREELVQVNIVDRIRTPKVESKIVEPLTAAEVRKLIDVCRGTDPDQRRDLALVMTMLDTGVRLSEVCGMDLSDWDQDNRRIKVYGKGRKERWVSLSPSTAKALWDYIAKARPQSFYDSIFIGAGQVPLGPSGVARVLKRRAKEAAIRHVNPHLLRHTFACTWASSGGPLHALQTLLGHTTPTMSLKYGRISSTTAAELHRQYSPVERLGLRIREKKK